MPYMIFGSGFFPAVSRDMAQMQFTEEHCSLLNGVQQWKSSVDLNWSYKKNQVVLVERRSLLKANTPESLFFQTIILELFSTANRHIRSKRNSQVHIKRVVNGSLTLGSDSWGLLARCCPLQAKSISMDGSALINRRDKTALSAGTLLHDLCRSSVERAAGQALRFWGQLCCRRVNRKPPNGSLGLRLQSAGLTQSPCRRVRKLPLTRIRFGLGPIKTESTQQLGGSGAVCEDLKENTRDLC
ncbi:hypothetical protein Anapl_13242 [Anas platyrhynchos]|uniref:Uncharacterized protein n=1 Tax=Anas platyrhynchos TaxID=8839 RepID=R0M1R9_ANAPL|nr:hypothetical protein Anapl_13242 [Anas platyrhynchos]